MCVTKTKNKCLQTLSYQGDDVGTRHTKRPDRDVSQGGGKKKKKNWSRQHFVSVQAKNTLDIVQHLNIDEAAKFFL